MLVAVLTVAFAAPSLDGEQRYHPGPGPETVEVEAWRLTGAVLARSTHVEAIEIRSDVGGITRLGGFAGVVRIEPAPGVSPVALANRLHALPHVAWSHPDLLLDLVSTALPDDPYVGEQWHLLNTGQRGYTPGVDINVEEAWDITTGAGMRIAVIDSGTDVDHPDIIVLDGHDYLAGDDSSDPIDGNNHGTAVAGIVAAVGNNGRGTAGIAYEADVYGIRLVGGPASTTDTYNAFVEAVDAGADVLNNSWGYENGCSGVPLVSSLRDAFDYAEMEGRDGLGSAVVFAAGNGACDVTNHGLLIHPPVIGVSAVSGFDVLENYSNFGPHIDIAAPSGNIATTGLVGGEDGGSLAGDDDYVSNFGGTSAAAPMVSGVVALMIASNPRIQAEEIRRVLCDTAVRIDLGSADYDTQGFSPLYGCGRVDAGAAVRAAANLGPPAAPEVAESAEVDPERVVLSWPEPTDPDADPLTYRVRWSVSGGEEQVQLVQRPWLDLTDRVGEGDVVQ